MTLDHVVLLQIIAIGTHAILLLFLYLDRKDRLSYQDDARREREFLIQVFARAVDKMSVLIARVEEELDNGK